MEQYSDIVGLTNSDDEDNDEKGRASERVQETKKGKNAVDVGEGWKAFDIQIEWILEFAACWTLNGSIP